MGEDKARLGRFVRNERKRQGYRTTSAWARHLGISARTLGDLERGHGAGPNTLAEVENDLGWQPGSARAILAGGDPTPVGSAVTPDMSPDEAAAVRAIEAIQDPRKRDMLLYILNATKNPPPGEQHRRASGR